MIRFPFRSRQVLFIIPVVIAIAATFLLVAWTRPVPRIVVEPQTQDLGEIPQQHLELTYTVRNEGKSSLHIEDVTTTCGCTQAAVDQATIPPGGSTLLRVTMDPQNDNLYGNLFRVITIRSNDPVAPEAKVDFHVSIPKPGG
ncbi:MAG: DUF1573 domain-containing protein [Chloroflexota bacterium]|nr:DUF1573 domain-containing protein [Chloroflexota bacterium]